MSKDFIIDLSYFLSTLLFCGEARIPLYGKSTRIKVEGSALYFYDEVQDVWTIHTRLTEMVRIFKDVTKAV